jgi:hypothetical protein
MTAGIAPCLCGIGDLYEPADAELDICEAVVSASKRAMTPHGLVHEVSVVIKPHVPRFVGTWAGGCVATSPNGGRSSNRTVSGSASSSPQVIPALPISS